MGLCVSASAAYIVHTYVSIYDISLRTRESIKWIAHHITKDLKKQSNVNFLSRENLQTQQTKQN